MDTPRHNKTSFIAFACAAVFLANIVPLICLPSTRLGLDWDFESNSTVIRSLLLHYRTFPLHNPWAAGGTDILANPQNWVFSPTIILELFLNPTYFNLAILIIWGLVGYWGFYKLLRFCNISEVTALILSAVFLNSSYFGLHFSEGHIAFASWQALGLILYLILNIDKIKCLFCYCMLMVFIILEGHIHVFLFSQIILLIFLASNMNDILRNIVRNYRTYLPNLLIIGGISAMIASVKLVPMLALYAKRAPVIDYENMSAYLTLLAFLDPFQHAVKDTHLLIHPVLDYKYRFHEYGCYIGIVAILILAMHIFRRKFFRENLRMIVLLFFFFWLGSGWLEAANPWKIFTKIPLLNNVHVASRLFVVVHVLCLVLIAKIFDGWRGRPARYWGLIIFLLIESCVVRNYPFYKLFSELPQRPHLKALITSDNIDKTVYYGKIPYHYFHRNAGSHETYEPAKIYTPVLSSNDVNYRGEIYRCGELLIPPARPISALRIEDRGEPNLKILQYLPGEIHIRYRLERPGCIQLNTNNLLGWKVAEGDVKVVSNSPSQLLTLETNNTSGEAVIKYRPWYLKWILMMYVVGIALAGSYWRLKIRRMRT